MKIDGANTRAISTLYVHREPDVDDGKALGLLRFGA